MAAHLRDLVKKGVLGDVLWFSLAYTGPTTYGPSLGNNPYGMDAFYTRDSGGFLFDDYPNIIHQPGVQATSLDSESLGRAARSLRPRCRRSTA